MGRGIPEAGPPGCAELRPFAKEDEREEHWGWGEIIAKGKGES